MKRGGTNLIEFSGEVKGLDAFHGRGDGGVDVGSMEHIDWYLRGCQSVSNMKRLTYPLNLQGFCTFFPLLQYAFLCRTSRHKAHGRLSDNPKLRRKVIVTNKLLGSTFALNI